jgi:hypothetical protein
VPDVTHRAVVSVGGTGILKNMSDMTQPKPPNENVPAAAEPKRITRMRLTEARLARYCEVLEQTGSHMEASRLASADNDIAPASDPKLGTAPAPGYQTFYIERRTNPEFAARCDQAILNFVGRAESELARRMFLPTERASLDKQGNVAHVSKDYRNADQLLLRALARHRPDEWSELARRQVDQKTTVTHNNAYAAGGAAYVISSEVIQLLDEDDRQLLGQLMVKAEEKRLQLENERKQQALLEGPNNG